MSNEALENLGHGIKIDYSQFSKVSLPHRQQQPMWCCYCDEVNQRINVKSIFAEFFFSLSSLTPQFRSVDGLDMQKKRRQTFPKEQVCKA